MDRTGADFYRSADMIRTRLGANPVYMQIPIGSESKFEGVIDLLNNEAVYWVDVSGREMKRTPVPEAMQADVAAARSKMVEQIVEHDDHLMQMYLDGKEPTVEQLKPIIRQATLAGKIFPVF